MTKVIIASFKEEAKAISALHKLIELESFGDISMYERIMVRKKANGELETLKEDSTDGWRTLTGMAVGGLIGALAGPVGFVVGLFTGTIIGGVSDAGHYDFEGDFAKKVEAKMPVGTVLIIAEIDEDGVGFIDSSLKPFDATIIRSDVDFEFDQYVDDQIEEIDEDIADERAKLKKAIGNDKEKIEKKIAELKAKRKSKIAEFEAKGKKTIQGIKDKAGLEIQSVKTGIQNVANQINESVDESRANRLKHRIATHEAKLKNLNKELKSVQV